MLSRARSSVQARWLGLFLVSLVMATAGSTVGRAATGPALTFAAAQQLPGAAGGTEPQIAVAPDGVRYAVSAANVTDSSGATAVQIYSSSPGGGPWTALPGKLQGLRVPGPDVAIAVTTTGRLVLVEEDSAALSLVVNYSDDGGKTWTESGGLDQLADEDRPWLTAGPNNSVSLLFHNGFSSNATQNMFVETSTDGGATFGVPVPITLPGTPEFADLQCADSGGPSALLVNPSTGRLYAIWGTRHGPLGGCGVMPVEPFTLVPADRVWVATSPTGAAGTWQSQVAVDDSATGQVVGMQLSPAALDSAGNLWLAWNTPPNGFPDDSGAGISVREASPTLSTWTEPQSVVDPGGTGHVLAQLVAGAPGRLGLLYLSGQGSGAGAQWFPQASVVTGAATSDLAVSTVTLLNQAAYKGTATDLMGSGCDPSTSAVGTLENNPLTCVRSADVIGIALDTSCQMVVSWPSVSATTNSFIGAVTDATWVATQDGGPSLCASDKSVKAPTAAAVVPAKAAKTAKSAKAAKTSTEASRATRAAKPAAAGADTTSGHTLASTGADLGRFGAPALALMAAAALLRRRRRRSG